MPRDIPYIVGGDLNSHFEPLVGLVEGFPMEEEFRWSVPSVVAPSPKAWTPVALQITALTLKHGIRACNGRIKSDVPSKTTYNRVGRESRLDYALVQIVNWSSILDFRVVERLDSDHNALELDLSHPGPKASITTMGESKPELLLDNNRRRIRWDKLATSQVKLSKLYAGLIPILEKVGELANDVGNIFHHEKLYQAHEDLIKGAASELFTRVQNQKRIQQHNSLWYNAVCRKAKGELLRCIKEGTDREKLRESRRAYKKLVIHAKTEWEENQWEELTTSLATRDHRMFWRVVNGGSGNLHSAIEPNIAAGVWQAHFQSLYSSEQGETKIDFGTGLVEYGGDLITVGETRVNLKLVQTTGGIARLMRSSTYRPLGPLIQIYKAQARGALMYGAELWGHTASCSLSITENNFIRQIVALPSSTPLLPLRMDLGLRPIADELGLRPIVFWRRLWSTEELSSYRAELREFLTHPKALQIPWIKYIKKSCMGLGLPDLWSDPANASLRIPRRALVSAYHEQKLAMALDCKNVGSLTSVFAQSKDSYRLERVLDAMSPVLARKLFLQWRYGTLPLRSYTCSWSTLPSTKLCPTCVGAEESDLHVVLFCPPGNIGSYHLLETLVLGSTSRCTEF
ncbi:hypothetical protein NDU88_006264 [Pleurodeles waltl]|uniref:Reverse transcriptase n=1 Tax=Pleurodeles waltl TaxID=8319 RepID=A0AAV7VQW4_PLEWA|nr:hypothetical protein NDU88_006264 [Pleurodeles waltl]